MAAGDDEGAAGSVSSYLDVKTGCLLEGGMSPRPFTQEVCVCVCVCCGGSYGVFVYAKGRRGEGRGGKEGMFYLLWRWLLV